MLVPLNVMGWSSHACIHIHTLVSDTTPIPINALLCFEDCHKLLSRTRTTRVERDTQRGRTFSFPTTTNNNSNPSTNSFLPYIHIKNIIISQYRKKQAGEKTNKQQTTTTQSWLCQRYDHEAYIPIIPFHSIAKTKRKKKGTSLVEQNTTEEYLLPVLVFGRETTYFRNIFLDTYLSDTSINPYTTLPLPTYVFPIPTFESYVLLAS